jgi:hypothetical protein
MIRHSGGSNRSGDCSGRAQLEVERLVIEPEVVADCAVAGQAALEPKIVSVAGVSRDQGGTS